MQLWLKQINLRHVENTVQYRSYYDEGRSVLQPTAEKVLMLPDGENTLWSDLTKLDMKKSEKFYYFMDVTAKILSKIRYYQLAAETKAYVQIWFT